MLLGLVLSVPRLTDGDGLGAHSWRSGAAQSELTRLLGEHWSSRSEWVLPRRVLEWLAVGELGPQVRQGCRGWLFLQEELAVYPQAAQALERRALMVAQASRLAAAQGISLRVVVVPDKSRVESAHLCGLPRPTQLQGRYKVFGEALASRGGAMIRLDQTLAQASGERYFRSDSHWNEQGAHLAAQAVADQVASLRSAAWPTAEVIELGQGPAEERMGDLIRLAGLTEAPARLRPAGDWLQPTQLRPAALVPSADLLGESLPPAVVVIGSSFSRTAHFVEFLSLALRTPVANMAKEGGGFAGAAMAYFRNAAFLQSPPQAIIWELPERVLEAPLSAEEQAWEARLQKGYLS